MPKPHITRTMGPIHFEDLDAHRFEDLVRELIYDFREWQSIEATGRGGSDDGFDVRAYEKLIPSETYDNEDSEEILSPMEGNMWMIQCKREKQISPAKIASIIESSVTADNLPYGYILVASANFSKKSFDTFREHLMNLGVMEFELWGKAKLEDLLHMPKYDRVLFTFFGISLITKRRSRTTEVRAKVSVKNKLIRIFENKVSGLESPVLIRDVNDVHYPFKDECVNFKSAPRWMPGMAKTFSGNGIWIVCQEYFAFVDKEKKEWDFTDSINLLDIPNKIDNEDSKAKDALYNKRQKVEDYWECLPKKKQAKVMIHHEIIFDNILLVDEKGDVIFHYPHLYCDFSVNQGPFKRVFHLIEIGYDHFTAEGKDYRRVEIFPKTFPEKKLGIIYSDKKLKLPDNIIRWMKLGRESIHEFVDANGEYEFLNPKDVIVLENGDEFGSVYIKITSKMKVSATNYLNQETEQTAQEQGLVTVFEFKQIREWELTD